MYFSKVKEKKTTNVCEIRNITYGEPIDQRRCLPHYDHGTVVFIIDDPRITYVQARKALQNSDQFCYDPYSMQMDTPFNAMRQKKSESSNAISDDSTVHQQSLIIEAHYEKLQVLASMFQKANIHNGYLPLQINRLNNDPENQQQQQERPYTVQVKILNPIPVRPKYRIYSLKDGPLGDPCTIQHYLKDAILAYLDQSCLKSVDESDLEKALVDIIPEYDIPESDDDDEKNDIPLFNGNLTFILAIAQHVPVSQIDCRLWDNNYIAKLLPREFFFYCKSCKGLDMHDADVRCPSVQAWGRSPIV